MEKIEKLTQEQEKLVPVWRDEWFKIGSSTEPANRKEAELAVVDMLKIAGKYNNQKIVWCSSWMTAELLQNVLLNNSLWVSLKDSLRDSLGASLRDSLRDSLWVSLVDSLRASLRDSLVDSLGASLADSLWVSLWVSLEASLGDSLRDSLGASLEASLRASLRDSLKDSLKKTKLVYHSSWFDGQIDSYWVCFYLFCRDVLGVKYQPDKSRILDLHVRLCKSANRVYFYEKQVLICERPEFIGWRNGRIHHDGGMAVRFRDRWGIWALNGVRVPQELAETPAGALSPEKWIAEENAEIRAQFIWKYGVDRLKKYGKSIERNDVYELIDMSELFKRREGRYTPYLFMINPSTGTIHAEGVSDKCRTINNALAWRDGETDYQKPEVLT